MTYDDAIKQFTVVVGDADMDGYLEIQNVKDVYETNVTKDTKTEEYTVNVVFTNTYEDEALPPDGGQTDSPKTGDITSAPIYVVLIGICGAVIVLMSIYRRYERQAPEK